MGAAAETSPTRRVSCLCKGLTFALPSCIGVLEDTDRGTLCGTVFVWTGETLQARYCLRGFAVPGNATNVFPIRKPHKVHQLCFYPGQTEIRFRGSHAKLINM